MAPNNAGKYYALKRISILLRRKAFHPALPKSIRSLLWRRVSSFLQLLLLARLIGFAGDFASAASIARDWDEQILSAIRNDTPHPPVHARNLFTVSAAIYDAWAAYDANGAVGFI